MDSERLSASMRILSDVLSARIGITIRFLESSIWNKEGRITTDNEKTFIVIKTEQLICP